MTRRLLWILAIVPFLLTINSCKMTPEKAKVTLDKKEYHTAADQYAQLYAKETDKKKKYKYA